MRILVIEDDLVDFQMFQRWLPNDDLTHVQYADAGFDLMHTERYDCVLLDMHLPDASGHELEKMASLIVDYPVILVSGYPNAKDVVKKDEVAIVAAVETVRAGL